MAAAGYFDIAYRKHEERVPRSDRTLQFRPARFGQARRSRFRIEPKSWAVEPPKDFPDAPHNKFPLVLKPFFSRYFSRSHRLNAGKRNIGLRIFLLIAHQEKSEHISRTYGPEGRTQNVGFFLILGFDAGLIVYGMAKSQNTADDISAHRIARCREAPCSATTRSVSRVALTGGKTLLFGLR